ncbi:hypothetical protein HDU78_004472 [Chytriomyces hyalinus]|nr:hypothetical protein HDU78_004472 [Chytriomyces hyalinus]
MQSKLVLVRNAETRDPVAKFENPSILSLFLGKLRGWAGAKFKKGPEFKLHENLDYMVCEADEDEHTAANIDPEALKAFTEACQEQFGNDTFTDTVFDSTGAVINVFGKGELAKHLGIKNKDTKSGQFKDPSGDDRVSFNLSEKSKIWRVDEWVVATYAKGTEGTVRDENALTMFTMYALKYLSNLKVKNMTASGTLTGMQRESNGTVPFFKLPRQFHDLLECPVIEEHISAAFRTRDFDVVRIGDECFVSNAVVEGLKSVANTTLTFEEHSPRESNPFWKYAGCSKRRFSDSGKVLDMRFNSNGEAFAWACHKCETMQTYTKANFVTCVSCVVSKVTEKRKREPVNCSECNIEIDYVGTMCYSCGNKKKDANGQTNSQRFREIRHDDDAFKEQTALMTRTWRLNNTDKVAKFEQKRRLNPNRGMYSIKSNANIRKIGFVESDCGKMMTLLDMPCHWCGLQSGFPQGLDRIDNLGVYSITNVVPSCQSCNIKRRSMSFESFHPHVLLMSQRLGVSVPDHRLNFVGQGVGPIKEALGRKHNDLPDNIRNLLKASECALCGVSPANGIDRIDNAIHYTVENSQPCCSACNYIKHTWSMTKLKQWIANVIFTIHAGVVDVATYVNVMESEKYNESEESDDTLEEDMKKENVRGTYVSTNPIVVFRGEQVVAKFVSARELSRTLGRNLDWANYQLSEARMHRSTEEFALGLYIVKRLPSAIVLSSPEWTNMPVNEGADFTAFVSTHALL